MPQNYVIAIDGPAAAGKSTVARALADAVGALLFDTGALYRAATLLALRTGTPVTDGPRLASLIEGSQIDIRPPTVEDGRLYDVYLNGEDVTWKLRTADIDANVSPVSAHAMVRDALLDVQRRIARQGRVVMVGRDIGTVVVPDASVKIYLDASPEERAARRSQELTDRGQTVAYDEVLADIKNRDRIDSQRAIAPLLPAPDATIVATDGIPVADVVTLLAALVRQAWGQSTPA
jgi:CMP/dCMP kinase